MVAVLISKFVDDATDVGHISYNLKSRCSTTEKCGNNIFFSNVDKIGYNMSGRNKNKHLSKFLPEMEGIRSSLFSKLFYHLGSVLDSQHHTPDKESSAEDTLCQDNES